MSDCANGGRNVCERPEGYPTLRQSLEFDEGNPWMYPIALNGREARVLRVDGPCEGMEVYVNEVRYVPARERDWDDMECE